MGALPPGSAVLRYGSPFISGTRLQNLRKQIGFAIAILYSCRRHSIVLFIVPRFGSDVARLGRYRFFVALTDYRCFINLLRVKLMAFGVVYSFFALNFCIFSVLLALRVN